MIDGSRQLVTRGFHLLPKSVVQSVEQNPLLGDREDLVRQPECGYLAIGTCPPETFMNDDCDPTTGVVEIASPTRTYSIYSLRQNQEGFEYCRIWPKF